MDEMRPHPILRKLLYVVERLVHRRFHVQVGTRVKVSHPLDFEKRCGVKCHPNVEGTLCHTSYSVASTETKAEYKRGCKSLTTETVRGTPLASVMTRRSSSRPSVPTGCPLPIVTSGNW